MTAPKLASTYNWGRMYARTRGGTPEVPSITTVLDVLNENMEWWEALCAVKLAIKHAEHIVDAKSMVEGRAKWNRLRAAKDWLCEAASRDRDDCSRRGDLVHDYAEAYCLRQIGRASSADVDEHRRRCEAGGAGDYLQHFHDFWARWQPQVLMPEATVWNHTHGYAGTTDLICRLNVRGTSVVAVMDWKTKRSLYQPNGAPKDRDLWDHTGMQLVAAARAEEVWVPGADQSDDRWEPFPYHVDVGAAVAFGPDGYVVRQFAIHDPLMWSTFTSLRSAWAFREGGPSLMSDKLAGPDDLRLPAHIVHEWSEAGPLAVA